MGEVATGRETRGTGDAWGLPHPTQPQDLTATRSQGASAGRPWLTVGVAAPKGAEPADAAEELLVGSPRVRGPAARALVGVGARYR